MRGTRLYAILDLGYVAVEDAVDKTRALLAGGAQLLQLRAKGVDRDTVRKVARELMPICRESTIPIHTQRRPATCRRT